MPEYLAPGVYVEEVSFRSKSIEGVATSTSAFVGPTRKGPLDGDPEVITNLSEFERLYGGLANLSFTADKDQNPDVTNYMAHAVCAYFDNGGKRLYIARCFVPRTDAEGVVNSTGIASVTIMDETVGNKKAEFFARNPGSGYNGIIRVYEKRTPSTAVTMNSAPEGSLLCVSSGNKNAPQPARVVGGKPPFLLKNGDQLDLILVSGTKSITFNGIQAEAKGEAIADSVDIPTDATLVVRFNDGVQQVIDLPDGNHNLEELLNAINASLRHGYARLEGGNQLVIGTDRQGKSAKAEVSKIDVLGFTSETTVKVNGSGNVADLEAVTVEEIKQILTDANIPVLASIPPSTGLLNLSTKETGDSEKLQIQDNAARIALSLPNEEAKGKDGATLLYYEKKGQEWEGGANGKTKLDIKSITNNAELLTLNLEAEDADNNTILYEGIGFSITHPRWLGNVLAKNPSRRADAIQNPYYFSATTSVNAFDLHASLFCAQSKNSFPLSGGNDGAEPTASTAVKEAVAYNDGAEPTASTAVKEAVAYAVAYKEGLQLFEGVDDISIIAAPGHSALNNTTFLAVQQELISHAERMKYRIAVLDTPPGQIILEVRDTRSQIDSSYAALYYPWVVVSNPLARPGNEQISREIALPPSGFVAGLYARTDITRGVWKAPANEVVRGALRFERVINQAQQEVLNPDGINCLRFFYGRGNRVWGARTASSDPEWKYVNIRRYFIYLEHSIDRSTQWAVFEPNGPRLWSNITDTITSFLYTEWRSGALLGAKPEQAFFVRCDRSTMTQSDLDNGRLICEIGVAAIKPAEFVIFRIGQKTADAQQ